VLPKQRVISFVYRYHPKIINFPKVGVRLKLAAWMARMDEREGFQVKPSNSTTILTKHKPVYTVL
jgi:hypothetical protein